MKKTFEHILFDSLNESAFPYFLQGTMNEEDGFPNDFVTYFVTDSSDTNHYDDYPFATVYYLNIILYTNNPESLEIKKKQLKAALKRSGFLLDGDGHDIGSSLQSHIGWAAEYKFKFIQ